jgi:hypothetical protein
VIVVQLRSKTNAEASEEQDAPPRILHLQSTKQLVNKVRSIAGDDDGLAERKLELGAAM